MAVNSNSKNFLSKQVRKDLRCETGTFSFNNQKITIFLKTRKLSLSNIWTEHSGTHIWLRLVSTQLLLNLHSFNNLSRSFYIWDICFFLIPTGTCSFHLFFLGVSSSSDVFYCSVCVRAVVPFFSPIFWMTVTFDSLSYFYQCWGKNLSFPSFGRLGKIPLLTH